MAPLIEEQIMLRDAARNWARSKSPVSAFRKMRDAGNPLGYDTSMWRDIAAMGWTGTIIPPAYGGAGLGYRAMGHVLEETGRTLTASPLLASGLAGASALLLGGNEAQKQAWLPKLAAGTVIASIAIDEGALHDPRQIATTAIKSDEGYRLSGSKTFVLDGMAADVLIVAARTSGNSDDADGVSLFLVHSDAAGLDRQRLYLADSRDAARIHLDNVPAQMLGDGGTGSALLDNVLDCARAGMAAEMLGIAQQAFETTLDYLKVRVQFGQVIGSFQSLQHRAAIMFVHLELARSAIHAALTGLDDASPEVPALVSLAKAKIGDTLKHVTNEMVQLHGGIGMTDEHDAGLYMKRARVCEAAFGNQSFHRDRYACLQGY